MSRLAAVRLLIACGLGVVIGIGWNAVEDGRFTPGYVLAGLLIFAAYCVAWTVPEPPGGGREGEPGPRPGFPRP